MEVIDILKEFFGVQGKDFESLENFKDYLDSFKQKQHDEFVHDEYGCNLLCGCLWCKPSPSTLESFLMANGISEEEAEDIAYDVLFEEQEEEVEIEEENQ